ncbi:TOBE domain-containing protein [Corynebacterium pilosum]|uniref:Molybdopterin-binding protein n=1 Tax=Corynebacterium pilosum TaxID=35756 RepID=A0A376CNV7_9CORY|nr:TOBE domain-containing protein [Corynebacterium pilosum]STC70114.1 Molybdopterin-binding protein [Corynebacterium pilosum]
MSKIKISTAAHLLGVSDDTVRRWVSQGRLSSAKDESGRSVVDGAELAAVAQEIAEEKDLDALDAGAGKRSARNHLTGLVTKVTSDPVMSQVELLCGPFRVVSLISTEAVNELELEVGTMATAVIKSTNVTIEGASHA